MNKTQFGEWVRKASEESVPLDNIRNNFRSLFTEAEEWDESEDLESVQSAAWDSSSLYDLFGPSDAPDRVEGFGAEERDEVIELLLYQEEEWV